MRTAHLLLVSALITAPLAGCITPGGPDEDAQGVVVTGQPVLDAFKRMGVEDQLVGIPDWAGTQAPMDATRIGRPFVIEPEAVIRLGPAIVLDHPHPLVSGPSRQALETGVEPAGIEYRQLPSDPQLSTVRTVLETVENVTGAPADPVWRNLTSELDRLNATIEPLDRPRALVLFPAGLTAGNGTDAHQLLELAGLRNVAAEAGLTGYRQITDEAIQRIGVDRVIATSTMRDTPEEIAQMPMFEGTAVHGNPERVLVVDPSRTMRLGPYLPGAVEAVATWAHPEMPGPQIHASITPMKVHACGSLQATIEAPNATVSWLGETHAPGTIPVPEVRDGHYILTVTARDTTGRSTVTQLVTVEGTECA